MADKAIISVAYKHEHKNQLIQAQKGKFWQIMYVSMKAILITFSINLTSFVEYVQSKKKAYKEVSKDTDELLKLFR